MQPEKRIFCGLEFWLVGSPELRRNADGSLWEHSPEVSVSHRLNRHAEGPFCRFGLPAAPAASGVYAILLSEQLKYVGRCENLAERFGPRGYGAITARNRHSDGQSTNCKINCRVLSLAKSGKVVQVWFHSAQDFVAVESWLIRTLSPEWNGRDGMTSNRPVPSSSEGKALVGREDSTIQRVKKSVSRTDFDRQLQLILAKAGGTGSCSIELSAGQLHRLVGGYPGANHRMPICCASMRAAMSYGDKIVYAPPKGNGAKLSIEYGLPRPGRS